MQCETQLAIAGIEDEGTKENGPPPETRKSKEMDVPQEHPESPDSNLILAQGDSHQTSDLQNPYCVKPPPSR